MNNIEFTLFLWGGSFVAGLLGALTGLGGGVVIIPLLTLGLGVDIGYAIGRLADLGDWHILRARPQPESGSI